MATYYRSQAAKAAGISIETLRFYEKNGIIPVPKRSEGGYRLYTDDVINRLAFIKRAKNSGFTLREIKHLFSVFDCNNPDWQYAEELLDKKIEDIGRDISELHDMMRFLEKVKSNLDGQEKCPILRSLLHD